MADNGTAWLKGTQLSDTTTDLNVASKTGLSWNTSQDVDANYFSYSGASNTRLTVEADGDYLVSVVVPYASDSAVTSSRNNIEVEIRVNGTKVDVGVGRSGYIRNANGHNHSTVSLYVHLDGLSANDYIEAFVARTTTETTNTLTSDTHSLYVEQLASHTVFAATGTQTTNSTNLNQSTAYEMEWSAELRKDSGFTHSTVTASEDITLDAAGEYLAFINIPLGGAVTRGNVTGKVLVGGTQIDGGQFKQGYIRNADGHTDSSIHWAGLVSTGSTNQVLSVSTELEGAAGTITTDSEKATITVIKLADTSGLYQAEATQVGGANDWNPGSATSVNWATDNFIDTDVYTHSTVTTNEDITVDEAGDYLLLFNVAFSSTTARVNPRALVFVNDSSKTGSDSMSGYIRAASGHNEASDSLVYFLNGLSANDIIEIKMINEGASGTANDDTPGVITLLKKEALASTNVSVDQWDMTFGTTAQAITTQAISATATFYNPSVTTGAVGITTQLISATATFYNPSVTTGAVGITTQAIDASATFYNPSVTTGAVGITTQLITATATLYNPSITTGAVGITTQAIDATVTVYNPSVTTGAVGITTQLITATATLYNPSVAVGAATITTQLIDASATLYNPSVTTGAVGITTQAIDASATLYNPSITTGAVGITTQLITATATLYNPSVTVGAVSVTTQLIDASATLYNPSITTGAVGITTQLITATATLYNPTITVGASTINTQLIDASAVVYNPSITTGAVGVTTQAIDATVTFYNPSITTGSAGITTQAIDASAVLYNPSITTGAVGITTQLIDTTATLYNPSITTGAVGLTTQLIDATATFYNPSVTTGAVSITTQLIDSTATLYNPSVAVGAVTITTQLIDATATLYNPSVDQLLSLTTQLIDATAVVYNPSVTTGAVSIVTQTIDATAVFYNMRIATIRSAIAVTGNKTAGISITGLRNNYDLEGSVNDADIEGQKQTVAISGNKHSSIEL